MATNPPPLAPSSLLVSWRSSGTCRLLIRVEAAQASVGLPSSVDGGGELQGLFQRVGDRASGDQSPQLRPVGSEMTNTNQACSEFLIDTKVPQSQ